MNEPMLNLSEINVHLLYFEVCSHFDRQHARVCHFHVFDYIIALVKNE